MSTFFWQVFNVVSQARIKFQSFSGPYILFFSLRRGGVRGAYLKGGAYLIFLASGGGGVVLIRRGGAYLKGALIQAFTVLLTVYSPRQFSELSCLLRNSQQACCTDCTWRRQVTGSRSCTLFSDISSSPL